MRFMSLQEKNIKENHMKELENDRDFHATELKRKQRSLIPLNIVVVIIALVAAVSLLFAPVISVDGEALSEVVSEMVEDQTTEDDESSVDTTTVTNAVIRSLGSHLSFSSVGLLEFALADNQIDYVTEIAASALEEETDTLIIEVGIPVATQAIKESNPDIEVPEIENPQAILDKFTELTTAEPEQVDEVIDNVADEIQTQIGTDLVTDSVRDEIVSTIRNAYDETVANTDDGSFSLEACICIIASQYLDLDSLNLSDAGNSVSAANYNTVATADNGSYGGNTDSGSKTVYTSYNDLMSSLLNSSSNETIAEINNVLETAAPIILGVAIAIMAIAALWAILALFAFVHIFTKNKRFTMWYVKIFGFIPCMLFGVLPMAASLIVSLIASEAVATIASFLGIITTMTWISGACYIVLWLISIFWAFPIKRKIRKEQAILNRMA